MAIAKWGKAESTEVAAVAAAAVALAVAVAYLWGPLPATASTAAAAAVARAKAVAVAVKLIYITTHTQTNAHIEQVLLALLSQPAEARRAAVGDAGVAHLHRNCGFYPPLLPQAVRSERDHYAPLYSSLPLPLPPLSTTFCYLYVQIK